MSQKQSVLNHLREHGHINPMEALNLYASFRLGAIIFELRKEHHIYTELVNDVNRFGKAVQYANYVYIGQIESEVNR